MTILSMITASAVAVMYVSHIAALRTQRPRSLQRTIDTMPVRIHRPGRG